MRVAPYSQSTEPPNRSALHRRRKLLEVVTSLGFAAPSVVMLVLFVFVPVIWTVQISFHKWDGLMPFMEYVGVSNFPKMFRMPQFKTALANNFIWAGMHIVFACGTGLLLAFLISRLRMGIAFFRTILFLPNVIALTLAAIMWSQIYNPTFGILNRMLTAAGLESLTRQWLADPKAALFACAIASCWQAYGYYMVLFLAGLQGIDASLYEAADLDGAGGFQQFVHVTIPGLKNVLTFVLSMAIINGLKGFATVWAMTKGGPEYATNLISLFVYKKAFLEYDFGVAAASAVVLGVMVMAITLLFNVVSDRINRD